MEITVDANKQIVQRLFDRLNANDADGMSALVAEDVVIHTPVPGVEPGRAGFRAFLDVFLTAFPGQSVDVDALLAEGDLVVARHTHHVTHTGEFIGLPPSGRTARVPGIEQFRVREGLIVEFWHQDDLFGLLQQLGAVPAPAATGAA
jgi:steroid delta-isomerase-like uncharacterized protein